MTRAWLIGAGPGDVELMTLKATRALAQADVILVDDLVNPDVLQFAPALPKTRSGKIMRRLLRDIAEGKELGDVTTLRDPDVMEQLEGKVKDRQKQED